MRNDAAIQLLTLVVFTAALFALPRVARALEPDIQLQQILHRTWTGEGRAPTGVRVFLQARDGRFWVGGAAGLMSFDGFNYELNSIGPGELPAKSVTSACTDREAGIWLGFEAGIVVRAATRANQSFGADPGIPRGTVRQLACALDGRVFAATDGGLALWQRGRWTDVTQQWGLPAGTHVLAVLVAADASVWVATADALLHRGAAERVFRSVLRLRGSVEGGAHLAQTPDDAIWMGTQEGGLLRLPSTPTFSTVEHISATAVTALLVDRDGCVWFGGEGLRRICGGRVIQQMRRADGLTANDVHALFQDYEGSIWLATSEGIDQFARSVFVRTPIPQALDGEKALIAGKDDDLWVGDRSHGIVIQLTGDAIVKTYSVPTPEIGLREDSGTIWFAGLQGLTRLSAGTVHSWPLPPQARSGRPRAMAMGAHGELWLSIAPQGLFRFRGGAWMQGAAVTGVPAEPPTAMIGDESGGLWLGYANGQLLSVHGGQVHIYMAADGLKSGLIHALYSTGHRLWIAGDDTLALFDGHRFYNARATNCGPAGPIAGVIEAEKGEVWLNRPFQFAVSPDAEQRIRAGTNLNCEPFRNDDGLPGMVQTDDRGPAMVRTDSGRIWVAAGGMLAWTDRRREWQPPERPSVTVASIKGDSLDQRPQGIQPFAAGVRDIQIRFHVWRLAKPNDEAVRYRLLGVDPEWHTLLRGTRYLTLGNLGPHQYVLEMQAQDARRHAWGPTETAAFEILPRYYETVWFRCLLFVIAALVIGVLFKMQLLRANARVRDRLEARTLERERIARDLHDTLLQGLQGLIFHFQAIADRVPEAEPARVSIRQVLGRADVVLQESRERVAQLRGAEPQTTDLPTALENVAARLATDRGPAITTEVFGRIHAVDATVHEEVLLIAREAVSNAVRHARATVVQIVLRYDRRYLRLSVHDDGAGIEADILKAGGREGHFGLRGMHERARKIRGGIRITAQAPHGTKVELWVSAGLAYALRSG